MSTPITLAPAPEAPPHHRVVVSPLGFDQTIAALKTAIAAADLWLIAEIDPQMLVAKADFAMPPARQLLAFHPRFMARLLALNPNGLPEAPIKFVVLAHADGVIRVHHPDPAMAFSAHAGLADLGAELAVIGNSVLAGLERQG